MAQGDDGLIRKALENSGNQLSEWLRKDEALNLPILGDLTRHGLSTDFHEIWIQTDEDGKWTAVIRRFFEHYILYAPATECDWDELGFFLRFSDPASVSGTEAAMEAMIPYLDGFFPEVSQMMILAGDTKLVSGNGKIGPAGSGMESVESDDKSTDGEELSIGLAGEGDAAEIGTLIFATDAFKRNYHSAEEVSAGILSRLHSGGVRHAILRKNGRIISHANTTTETEGYALISGVTTRAEELRKGHAARLVSWLCSQLLSEGRQPCLFCKSQAALAMYGKLGFVETGTYVTCRREA